MNAAQSATQPESFPNPTIRRSTIRKLNVSIRNPISNVITIEEKSVIESGSGNLYELGSVLKKAIFGQVVHAILLKRINEDTLFRTESYRAIKIYSKRILRSLQGKTQENPLMEISALQFIGDSHANLMGQIECCTDDENIYSVMRFIRGGEMYDYIDEHGPCAEDEARRIIRQLLNALQHLQSLGIGHRDMSLENILYDFGNAQYIVIDFGMCLRMNTAPDGFSDILKQPVCGKRNYISPEVIRQDASFNPALSDVWALGIILFIVLTGVPAVDAAIPTDDRYNMICADRLGEMLMHWGIDLSAEVVDLMQQILRPNPRDRLTLSQIIAHPWLRTELAAFIYNASIDEPPECRRAIKSVVQNREGFRCARGDCGGNHSLCVWNSADAFHNISKAPPDIKFLSHGQLLHWQDCWELAVETVDDCTEGATHFSRNSSLIQSQLNLPVVVAASDTNEGDHLDTAMQIDSAIPFPPHYPSSMATFMSNSVYQISGASSITVTPGFPITVQIGSLLFSKELTELTRHES